MAQETNNMYHEQVRQSLGQFSQEKLVERIKAYQEIVDKLDTDKLWKIVLNDAQIWVKRLDAGWQDVQDEKQLNHMRMLKSAYAFLINLPQQYKVHLETAQDLLDNQRNTDSTVQKDYDQETKTEQGGT